MCGICGLYSPSGFPPPDHVDAMRARIRHRGPDQGSTDAFGACVLGHQRLRVLDPELGYQPVANERGDVVAVFNGELYNFRELRAELAARGHEVRGRGDTPVIPHLYEEFGLGFVERLEGMFAIALWDAAQQRLVLVRDRLGKKPLAWTRLGDGTLAFASEVKALLALPSLGREPDLAALDAYLALQYVPGERTGLRGIERLPPASLLVADASGERIERYWQPSVHDEKLTDEAWVERVREEVAAAVRKRLAADVPLGALLSGGVDSAVVVALMASASTQPVRTFTVGFPDERYDERAYARAVAERYDTQHVEIVLEPDAADTLPRLAEAFDEPLGDEAALPLFLICEAARREVTVGLVGDGGDESFAGYERYVATALAEHVPQSVAAAGAGMLRRLPAGRRERRSPLFRAARFLEAAAVPRAERYGRLMQVFTLAERAELWSDDAKEEIGALASAGFLLGAPPTEGTTGLQLLDVATYLPGDLLPKSDIASMAHSLELRSPLLDHRVVELGLSLPDSLKHEGRRGKIALRRAFGADLPSEVLARGKAGFGVPLAQWFRGELRPLARELLLDERARSRGWFRRVAVERLLDDHAAGRADNGHRLWTLTMLELWQRTHVDAPVPRAVRVVHVHRMRGIGGSERHLLTLLPALTDRGVDAVFVGLDDPEWNPADFYSALTVPALRIPAPRDVDPLLLARLLRDIDADVVHTHLVHADLYGGIAARLRGARLVSTKHNDDPFRTGRFRHIERGIVRLTDRIVTISDALRRFTIERVGIPASKVETIHYGLDELPAAWGENRPDAVPDGATVLLSTSRLTRQKGVDVAVRALTELPSEAVLVVLGEGPERESLEALAESLGVRDRVFLLGRVPDVAAWLRRASVYVHPARWEGFGLAVLEAMVGGLPVVSTNVSSLPELVADGDTGVLVPPDDPSALARGIALALGEPQLGAAGRERARREFSVWRMADRTVAVYDNLERASS